MHRIIVQIPFPWLDHGIPIFSYGLMLMLGFAAGVFVAWRRARKINVPLQIVLDLGMYTAIAGIIGARLAYIFFEVDKPFTEIPWSQFIAIWEGGLVLQGGLVLLDGFDEFGYSDSPMGAVDDLRLTLSELYWSLKDDEDSLGTHLSELWYRISGIIRQA